MLRIYAKHLKAFLSLDANKTHAKNLMKHNVGECSIIVKGSHTGTWTMLRGTYIPYTYVPELLMWFSPQYHTFMCNQLNRWAECDYTNSLILPL